MYLTLFLIFVKLYKYKITFLKKIRILRREIYTKNIKYDSKLYVINNHLYFSTNPWNLNYLFIKCLSI